MNIHLHLHHSGEIHIHQHIHGDDKLFTEIKSINLKLNKMGQKNDEILAGLNELKASAANISADLDRIATNVEGGLTADEADNVAAEIRSLSTQMKTIADRHPETTDPGTGDPGTGGTTPGGTDPNANL